MQRVALSKLAPICRTFSTSTLAASKASKGRKLRPSPPAPSSTSALRGTGVGASSRLYSPDEVAGGQSKELPVRPSAPDAVEQEMLQSQGGLLEPEAVVENKEDLRGTGVGASKEAYPAGEVVEGRDTAAPVADEPRAFPSIEERQAEERQREYQGYGEEETIFTANPPFNVPLVLSVCFVMSVFAITGADAARVGLADYNKETEEYELAPAWKRYTFAGGFIGIAGGLIWWGSVAPGRIVTKLTMRRALDSPSRAPFPRDALVTIHSPITKLPGLSPRTVSLESIHLLGPISDRPQAYHPTEHKEPERPLRTDPVSTFLRHLKTTFIAPARARKPRNPWTKGGGLSHSPILISGDRASYSLAVKRGPTGQPLDPKGAWCKDWEGLERALLKVEEGV